MIFDELSNAFFRLSLPFLGAEVDGGGCSNTPPPQQVVENLDTQQGAG